MFRVFGPFSCRTPNPGLLKTPTHVRNIVTATAVKQGNFSEPTFTTSEEGYRLACLTQPSLWTGTSRLAIVFNAGAKCEQDCNDHGITHLIRRACGLSTMDHTAVNMTRHFQQMGAKVTCTTTREHMVYTVDVAPNLVSRAGYLLAEMVTGPAYYQWELKNTANRLMKQDIEILNRQNFAGLSMELLHQAAFGQNPLGTGLGNSLFAASDHVGTYSLEQIERFHQHFFTPTNCTMALVGHDAEQDGMELLREIKNGLQLRAPRKVPEKAGKVHGFVGGDLRRSVIAAPRIYANLAWATSGKDSSDAVTLDVAASLLTGCSGRVSFGGNASAQSPEDDIEVMAFHKAYSGHGLFGVSVSGSSASAVNDRLSAIAASLSKLKCDDKQLASAKSLRKADILMELESAAMLATDLAIQSADAQQTYKGPREQTASVDAVTAMKVQEALKKLTPSVAALSVVGPEANHILPLKVLLSSS